ncbi:MAG: hypothetical protein QGI78_00415 [Phycisphaerales bacterium]|jgi:glucose/arabinose dehydrogenase|nr:hypothetical protein [Phycisphaerales bacterium]
MFSALLITTLLCTNSDFWTIDYLTPPDGEVLEVGGIGFMSDGDMVVSTRRGQVWRIDQPNAENPEDATFTLICEGLHEGMGLAVVQDEVYVAQRCELSKLVDLDGDALIDEVQTLTQDWGMSGNYHEFSFGLPVDADGNMYVSLNVGFWNPHWWHGKSRAPYRGWVLKISPDGHVEPFAGGFRSPAGLGLLEDNSLVVTDNQGDWMPVCPVYVVKKDKFYGHPASLRWYENQPDVEPSDTQPPSPQTITREHPALWLPYQWSRSTGNVIVDNTNGPFHGQYLIAELTNGQILRADFEEIDGVVQGACWLAHTRVGSAYHIAYGPDGTLYAGLTNRGWGGLAPGSGIARIQYAGDPPLEMKEMHLIADGFEITFTEPLVQTPVVSGEKYDYNWWWEYGSPVQHLEPVTITDVSLSEDRRIATVTIGNLEAGKCIMLHVKDAEAQNGNILLHSDVSYTINALPGGELAYVAKQVEPPIERGEKVGGWMYLTWADAFDMWVNDGVIACNAELDIEHPSDLVITEGSGALVAKAGAAMRTKFNVDSGTITMNYMLAEGAELEVQLPNGGVITLSDQDDGGYLGAGIWHEFAVSFASDPPTIHWAEVNSMRTHVNQTVHTRLATPSPIVIRSTKGTCAFGDVRLQHLPSNPNPERWKPIGLNLENVTEEGITWKQTDAGDLVVEGNGSLTIPIANNLLSAVRFDAKVYGTGAASMTIGTLEIDIATNGSRKTGGVSNHPINANLIDQNEWCTIEILQQDQTTVLLNGVAILTTTDISPIAGDTMTLNVKNATLHVRKPIIHSQ